MRKPLHTFLYYTLSLIGVTVVIVGFIALAIYVQTEFAYKVATHRTPNTSGFAMIVILMFGLLMLGIVAFFTTMTNPTKIYGDLNEWLAARKRRKEEWHEAEQEKIRQYWAEQAQRKEEKARLKLLRQKYNQVDQLFDKWREFNEADHPSVISDSEEYNKLGYLIERFDLVDDRCIIDYHQRVFSLFATLIGMVEKHEEELRKQQQSKEAEKYREFESCLYG